MLHQAANQYHDSGPALVGLPRGQAGRGTQEGLDSLSASEPYGLRRRRRRESDVAVNPPNTSNVNVAGSGTTVILTLSNRAV